MTKSLASASLWGEKGGTWAVRAGRCYEHLNVQRRRSHTASRLLLRPAVVPFSVSNQSGDVCPNGGAICVSRSRHGIFPAGIDAFVAQLNARGVEAASIVYKGDGHFFRRENQLDYFARVEALFARCLGGRSEPTPTLPTASQ